MARHWRCYRLTLSDPPLCTLATMGTLSVDEVDRANLLLDAIEDARIRARKTK